VVYTPDAAMGASINDVGWRVWPEGERNGWGERRDRKFFCVEIDYVTFSASLIQTVGSFRSRR
jgi:hypothetical protein